MKKIICSLFIICLILAACGGSDGNNYSDSNNPEPENEKITYSVSSFVESCYDMAYITYLVPGVDYYDIKVNLPWSYSFDTSPGDYLYLYATPAHMADIYCVPEYDLNLAIKKDDITISEGLVIMDDPNSYEIDVPYIRTEK